MEQTANFEFPSKFVFEHKLDNHIELKKVLFPLIMDKYESKKEEYLQDFDTWDCKVITSFFDDTAGSMFNEYPELYKSIWKSVDDMFNNVKLNCPVPTSNFNKIWFNIYRKGYNQEVHQHCGSDFSGVYILHCTEPNKTVFYSNEGHRLLNKTYKTEHIKEGSILLFPSHLSHYVNQIEDDMRITIAFNITCNV